MTTATRIIRNAANHTVAAIDTGSSWIVETWNTNTDERQVVDELLYAGRADRTAARHMARGTVASVVEQLNAGAL